MLTFALLFGVLGGVKARDVYATLSSGVANGNATWNLTESVYTYTWTDAGDSRNDYISLFAAFGGTTELDWSEGTNIVFTCSGPTSSETNALDVIIMANGKKFSRAMYSDGTKTLTLTATSGDGFKKDGWGDYITAEDLKHVTDFRFQATNKFGKTLTTGSVTISNLYVQLSPKTSVSFNASGIATLSLENIDVSGNVSYDPETQVVTCTGSGSFQVNLDKVNFKSVNQISLSAKTDGGYSDILSSASVQDNVNGTLVTWSYSKWNYTFTSYQSNAGQVICIKFNVNSGSSASMKINSITITGDAMSIVDGHDVPIASLNHYNVAADGTVSLASAIVTRYNVSTDIPLGDGGGEMNEYIDIEDYDELRIYTSDNMRVFMINEEITSGTNAKAGKTLNLGESPFSHNSSDNYYYASVSAIKSACNGQAKIIGVKQTSGGSNVNVSKIQLIKANPTYDYKLLGQYSSDLDISSVTSDASAVAIDCSNLRANGVVISSANPNALFKANAGVLTNTKNVIVGSTCANLELTDGKPFKAPVAFTATAAKFTKTVSDAGYATMVIPFAAVLPTGVKAYNLTGVAGESITYSSAETIAANSPVMIEANENVSGYEFTASNVEIAATANGVVTNGLLNGGYATMTAAVDANNYVLQKNGDDVNFYLVTGTAATVKPFRAYLTAPATARELTLNFGETTGISASLMNSDERIVKSEVYNLNGQRVAAPQKGLYIVNGKKVIVK